MTNEEEINKILFKYMKCDGWSNGYVIEFWNMTKDELNKVNNWYNEHVNGRNNRIYSKDSVVNSVDTDN